MYSLWAWDADTTLFSCLVRGKRKRRARGAVLYGVLPQKSRLTRCHYSLMFMLCIPSSVEFFT